MSEQTFAPDDTWAPKQTVNACCAFYQNLVTIERREQVQVRKCSVCGSRHFRALMLQPGLVMTGAQ